MKKDNLISQLKETVKYLKSKKIDSADIAVIAGSGLGVMAELIKNQVTVPYKNIPHFKISTVKGHAGSIVFGRLSGKKVLLLNGRLHYYEGYTMQEISYPVKVLNALGVKTLIITCAVGAVNAKYDISDIVAIKDHINFMGTNPLIGKNYDELGPRFCDMSNVYDEVLRKSALKIAKHNKIKIYEGIYFAVTGPSYETPAEISAFSKLGADVVGMSLIPESITANYCNIKVLALTYISNKAAGISDKKLSHEEVLSLGTEAGKNISKIIYEVIKGL